MDFQSLGRYLRFTKQINQLYQQMLHTAAERLEMTRPEADVLLFLANSPQPCTARDACEYRGFSKAYVSKAVEALSRRGFLEASTTEEDRRLQRLTILPAAEPAITHLHQMQEAFLSTLTAGIQAEEEAALRRVMTQVSNNLK